MIAYTLFFKPKLIKPYAGTNGVFLKVYSSVKSENKSEEKEID